MLCYLILQRISLKNNGKWYNSLMAEKIFHSIGGNRGKADHPGQGPKPMSRISVRTLVEFLLRSGDLDSRAQRGMDVEAALAGGRIHRKLQKAEKGDYAAEVMLSRDTEFEDLVIRVEGRADGIIGYLGLQQAGKSPEATDEQADQSPERTDGQADQSQEATDEQADQSPEATDRQADQSPEATDEQADQSPERTDVQADQSSVIVDEIKGMYLDVAALEEPFPVHLAQAKCYAAICADRYGLGGIGVRMTYVNLETEEVHHFHSMYTGAEIEEWYRKLVQDWYRWAKWQLEHIRLRNASMKHMDFPFPYRAGQQKLTAAVYHAIKEAKELFLMAPTGVGKTMSCVFPAVRAIGEEHGDRIFYLTAKNETLSVGTEAFSILLDKGLDFRTIRITSKEKICPLNEPSCNPDDCMFAKGHFDRINEAVFDLIQKREILDRSSIMKMAVERRVCPFELTLDTASWCDAILCDYNYVFDPDAQLKRFFAEGTKGGYIFLIDEAHNLVERGRDMYSAVLVKEHVLGAKRILKDGPKDAGEQEAGTEARKEAGTGAGTEAGTGAGTEAEILGEAALSAAEKGSAEQMSMAAAQLPKAIGKADGMAAAQLPKAVGKPNDGDAKAVVRALERVNRIMLELKRRMEDSPSGASLGKPYLLIGFAEADELLKACVLLYGRLQAYYEESKKTAVKEALLDFYFEIRSFVSVSETLDENYVIYAEEDEEGHFAIKLFCVNPAGRLSAQTAKGRMAVLFSATLLPLDYYRRLLTTKEDPYAVYAPSPFEEDHRLLLLASDISTRFADRGEDMYRRIARYIQEMAKAKTGNYLVFFPSYRMLKDVFEVYRREFDVPEVNWVLQSSRMQEDDREIFLENFYEDPEHSLVGFCVMGGMFSEGIDLTGTKLIGAAIVGAGLPQVSNEREILKDYYGRDGFDYAYRFPGINKVEQAAGRVIRTAEDLGVILLLDERLLASSYTRLFPREWRSREVCTVESVREKIREFWEKHLNFDK